MSKLKRRSVRKGKDKKVFSRTANRASSLNFKGNPMRGGIRL